MIRALIADCEPLARQRLRHLLSEEGGFELIAECTDGAAAIAAIESHDPDLVFLDASLPDMDGFEIVERAAAGDSRSYVFVTANESHASRAFEVGAVDYLLKPVTRERFRETAERARHRVAHQRPSAGGAGQPGAAPRYLERFMVRAGNRIVVVATDDIEWVAGSGNYVKLHCGGASHLLRLTLRRLETQLDPRRFFRIHRSTIVRLDRLSALEVRDSGEYAVILKDGTRLGMSRRYRTRIDRVLKRIRPAPARTN